MTIYKTGLDWTILISEIYWPLVVLIIFFVLFFIFKNKIEKIIFKTTYGEMLFELNQSKNILDKKYKLALKDLETNDIWFLYDVYKDRIETIPNFNVVQKFAYKRLKNSPFLKKENSKLSLTYEGKKVIELVDSIDL